MTSLVSRLLEPRQERWLLFTLAAINFTHIVDFMVMMPLGPQFIEIFQITDAQFGFLVSSYTLAAGFSGLLATSYIDRFERKGLLLRLYAAFALSTLACGLAPNYTFLMIARIASGLFGGVLAAMAQTMVGDAIPFERRGRAMSIVMGSFSLATVAGVPLSLWLASMTNWHGPFIAVALMSGVIWVLGYFTLPRMARHISSSPSALTWRSAIAPLNSVLVVPNHLKALVFSAFVMSASFVVIPYITIFATANLHLTNEQLPLIYLFGGLATLFTIRIWGVLTDKWGKVRTFRLIALLSMAPLLILTHLKAVGLWELISVTTLFFIFVSGRMVPSMAILTSTVDPRLRGTFMSLNSATQSCAMGLASFVGGLLIHRDAQGQLMGYTSAGWLAAALTLLAVFWVGQLKMLDLPDPGPNK
jgi:predicted MFS family arabinose efflux permease